MNRREIYFFLAAMFGGIVFSSLFLSHSNTWQLAIIPMLIGVFGLIFDRK